MEMQIKEARHQAGRGTALIAILFYTEAEPEFHFIAFHIAQVVITRQAQCVFPMFWYESLAYIVLYARADYLGPHRP